MRRKIIAGNWKMNGNVAFMRDYLAQFKRFLSENQELDSEALQVILVPPAILLSEMTLLASGSSIGIAAQNVSSYESGAYTGEISAAMLADVECAWCLVGHSERRALFGETDRVVVDKVKQLLRHGIRPILCVGETLEQREKGQAASVVIEQIEAVVCKFTETELKNVIVAYEPVWAIGTGKTASPEQAQEMHKTIRLRIAEQFSTLAEQVIILYGGSVNSGNAQSIFVQKDIDGGLVGGASLKIDEFSKICEQAI